MPEPVQTAVASVSLMTLAVAVFGPLVGPYIVILLGSIAGGLWALSGTATQTRTDGAWLMLRCIFTAGVLTSVIAGLVEAKYDIKVNEAYAVVSFVIGMMGNQTKDIIDAFKARLQILIASAGGSK